MTESVTETLGEAGRTASVDQRRAAAPPVKDALSSETPGHRIGSDSSRIGTYLRLVALLMGAVSIYLCLQHWLAAAVIATIVLGAFVLVWLVDDYGQSQRKSSVVR